MGALHTGHASLIEHARRECGTVVVSIFVNPLQFDRPDDLERYPRSLNTDLELCRAHGVDLVFAPAVTRCIPPAGWTVDVGRVADHFCGRYRPGHFHGVATVVLKLLQIVQADRRISARRTPSSWRLCGAWLRTLMCRCGIVGVPTVREPDGLAMSSRNRRLNADERALAPVSMPRSARAASVREHERSRRPRMRQH